jgi:hypothetical protein
MFKKIIHFLKYHNAAVFILAAVFLLGSAVFASEDIQSAIGAKEEKIEGFDNSLLLQADLENFNMEFTIDKVQKESGYYYVSFGFFDLVKEQEGWQYKLKNKVLKFKEKPGLAIEKITGEELAEIRQARIRFLRSEREKAKISGQEGRFEAVEYTGLIGKAFDAVSKIFPGFEPGGKKELPLAASLANFKAMEAEEFDLNRNPAGSEIDLTEVYASYLIETGSVDGTGTSTEETITGYDPSSDSNKEPTIEPNSEESASAPDSSELEVEIIDLDEVEVGAPNPETSAGETSFEPAQDSSAAGE